MSLLPILFQDQYIVAINKPAGMLVHRSSIAADAEVFVLQELRNQLGGRHIYPVHRLDRKTSGVLVFALDSATAALLQQNMEAESSQKIYRAIVRGYFPDEIACDRALTNDRNKTQEAFTRFRCLSRCELPIAFGAHSSSRYSLIEAMPITGRQHQIRKHLNHLRHPIIGDRPHGCNKQNRLFKERWGLTQMLLHAASLSLLHPHNGEGLCIEALASDEFERIRLELGLGL